MWRWIGQEVAAAGHDSQEIEWPAEKKNTSLMARSCPRRRQWSKLKAVWKKLTTSGKNYLGIVTPSAKFVVDMQVYMVNIGHGLMDVALEFSRGFLYVLYNIKVMEDHWSNRVGV